MNCPRCRTEIPANLVDEAAKHRERLLEAVAEVDDELAVVEGERDALDRFEWKISSGPRGARVDHVNRETGPATGAGC